MEKITYTFEKTTLNFTVENGRIFLDHIGEPTDKENAGSFPSWFNAPVEVQVSGDNHLEHHFAKHYRSSGFQTLLFKEKRLISSKNGEDLLLFLADDKMEVVVKYSFLKGAQGFRSSVSVKNIGTENMVLDYVSAFEYVGIDGEHTTSWQDCVNIYIPHNYWKTECSWRKYSVKELGLYDCSEFSAKRVMCSNVGTWSTKEFLPSGMLENTQTGRVFFWQIEGSLSWQWEISTINNRLYLLAGGANLQEGMWQKKLAAGDAYTTPAVFVSFGNGVEDVMKNVTDYRRKRRVIPQKGFGLAPIFNDYMNCLDTDPTTEKELPLIKKAAELGCEYYMIDAGWYSDGFWWDNTGEWIAAKTRFAGGLKRVTDEIRRFGMKPGLWIEIEVMSCGLPYANDLPDEWFFIRNGKRVIDNSRYILNFSNKEVRYFADESIKRLIEEYGAEFIKMDHNVNGGVGMDGFSYGSSLEEHWRAFNDWFEKIVKKYPNVVFENCASGGCRIDQNLLDKYDLQSTSDQTDYKKYAPISANSVTAVLPEQAGVWTYPLEQDDAEAVVFNMVNAILLHIYQSGRIDLISKENFALVKEAIDVNKSISETILNGHAFWPLGLASYDDKYLCFGIAYKQDAYLCVWNRNNLDEFAIPLKKYGVENAKQIYPERISTDYRFEENDFIIQPHQKYFARLFKLIK
ncbi:MAG: alpha-galactosidase [Clostridia bacterium]|nr:alpha-galactosidase [Clostridia bacterium]